MRMLVVANAVVDETYDIEALPLAGESLVGEFRSRDLGGKGANVATVLARCGVPTVLVAAIGADDRGAFVRAALAREPVELALQVLEGRPTDVSFVYRRADGDNAIVTTVATTRALDVPRTVTVMERFGAGDVLVLQGNLRRETTIELMDAAQRLGLAIAWNPSPWMPWADELTGRARSVFVNEGEARAMTGKTGEAAVRALLARGSRDVVLTRGPLGALLGHRGGARNLGREQNSGGTGGRDGHGPAGEPNAVVSVPAAPATPLDTTGAGDTYLAVALAPGERDLCCGRTYLATGMVERARTEARRTVAALLPWARRGVPIVGLEPSCLLTLRDEFLPLLPGEEAETVAGEALLLEELLARDADAGRPEWTLGSPARRLLVHGHCHPKAFGVMGTLQATLALLPDTRVDTVETSCCGMAGAFGYGRDTHGISASMAGLDLLPAVRAASDETLVVADGTSCRHQIRDLGGREAVHVARVLDMALDAAPDAVRSRTRATVAV